MPDTMLDGWANWLREGWIRTWPQERAEIAYRAYVAGWAACQIAGLGDPSVSAWLLGGVAGVTGTQQPQSLAQMMADDARQDYDDQGRPVIDDD